MTKENKLSLQDYLTKFSSSFFRINFLYRSIKPIAINVTKVNYSGLGGGNQWKRCGNLRYRQQLFENNQFTGRRSYAMLVGRILRGALKIRYLVLGGAVGGTVTMNRVRVDLILLVLTLERFFTLEI